MRHFLQETDFSRAEAGQIFTLARRFKQERGSHEKPLAGQTWAMIFAKSSTRTRVSFEVGIHELGGNPLFLNTNDIQIGRGETIADTAKVLSRFVHGLVVRTYAQSDLANLAEHGGLPVVNALTDFLHPCQIYADAFTAAERWAGPQGDLLEALAGRKVAFLGDTGFNIANSWRFLVSGYILRDFFQCVPSIAHDYLHQCRFFTPQSFQTAVKHPTGLRFSESQGSKHF